MNKSKVFPMRKMTGLLMVWWNLFILIPLECLVVAIWTRFKSLALTPSQHQGTNSLIVEAGSGSVPAKKTYIQRLSIFSGVYTEESFWTLFIRPFALILLPQVLWCSLVQSVTIGFMYECPQVFFRGYLFLPASLYMSNLFSMLALSCVVFCYKIILQI